MQQEQAEIIALNALAYLAGQEEAMTRFAALSGVALADIQARADDPEMLAGVLDFLLSDDALVTEFCQTHDLSPELPQTARQALPGGDIPNWT